ncbi:MAG: FAD-dependent oxidoreductase [Lachnospiraceae bacterium]|nr:FAD-dependent oxidoreductase [Lachnospiraceae bacterium]
MYDAIVVGAGVVGCVVAGELARRGGKKVLVIDKRDHIAGNCYDEYDEYGIMVHVYGPHIFHTEIERVADDYRSSCICTAVRTDRWTDQVRV